jgi:phosphatidate phosphatase APP1
VQQLATQLRIKTILVFAFALFSELVFAKTLVVADIDDTLRVTNRLNAGWLQQLDNARDPSLMFVGMDLILESLSQDGATIFYVTAAISPLDELSKNFLRYNQLPQRDNFINKGWFNNTEDFKTEAIAELIRTENPSQVILLGDNGEHDSAAYARVAKNFPNTVIFIHKLYEGEPSASVPLDQSVYLTGADLAASLEQLGFLSNATAKDVADQTLQYLNNKNTNLLVLPDWAEVTENDISRVYDQTDTSTSNPQSNQQSNPQLSQIFSTLGF